MHAVLPNAAGGPRPVRIPLSVNDPNAGRSLTRCVERMLRDGRHGTTVVVELHGSHLPAPLVAELIGSLRRLREVGGALAVEAATPALRGAIVLHGLDRVLDRSRLAGDDRHERRTKAGTTAWSALALLLLTAAVAAGAIVLELSPGFGGL